MSLAAFQRAIADMAASPALTGRVKREPETALAGYDLTDRERRRLASAAGQQGMVINCMLFRANRLAPVLAQLPCTCHLLGPELRAVADAFWTRHPDLERNVPHEIRRFHRFLREHAAAGGVSEPLVGEVLEWEMVGYEIALKPLKRTLAEIAESAARARPDAPLRAHPLVGVAALSREPTVLLPALFARQRPPFDHAPVGDFHLLVDGRGDRRRFDPVDGRTADAIRALQAGRALAHDDAAELIGRGLAVAA